VSFLETRNASVYRGGRKILSDITVRLDRGQLLGIVGPNGSGKSSLLRTLGGLWKPTSGEALLDGKSLAMWSRRELARRVSFVPQDTRVDFAFTVQELVSMGRYPHRGRFSHETNADRAAVQSAMQQCDVHLLAHRNANTLSGGELQRVLIARSLAVEPDFILLDEPTSSLDVEHSLDVLGVCHSLSGSGKAVAITTHDLNTIARCASSIILLSGGSLVAQGPGDCVLTPAALASVFKVDAEVLSSQNGERFFLFHNRRDQSPEP
jgi:cobalamin transport system ATP-binding protein